LGMDGLLKLLFRTLKTELREGEIESAVALLEDLPGCGGILIQVQPHAHFLRPLSGKDKSDVSHGFLHLSPFALLALYREHFPSPIAPAAGADTMWWLEGVTLRAGNQMRK
jgi:hypothetical protein